MVAVTYADCCNGMMAQSCGRRFTPFSEGQTPLYLNNYHRYLLHVYIERSYQDYFIEHSTCLNFLFGLMLYTLSKFVI